MISKEIWKLIDIKEVKICRNIITRKYYVSNLGRCKINDKIIEFKPKKKAEIKGYYVFHGKRVHRWVAELFISNPDNLPCIDHIDTNIHNNRVDNLRWVDYKGNANNEITIKKRKEWSNSEEERQRRKESAEKQWEEKRDKMVHSLQKSQSKRTASILKVMKTQSYHDNMSVTQKGRKWINNGIEQKKLFPEDIEPYLLNGWTYGMLNKSA